MNESNKHLLYLYLHGEDSNVSHLHPSMLTTFIGISGLRLIIQKQTKNTNILLQVVIALEIRHTSMYMHGVLLYY